MSLGLMARFRDASPLAPYACIVAGFWVGTATCGTGDCDGFGVGGGLAPEVEVKLSASTGGNGGLEGLGCGLESRSTVAFFSYQVSRFVALGAERWFEGYQVLKLLKILYL